MGLDKKDVNYGNLNSSMDVALYKEGAKFIVQIGEWCENKLASFFKDQN